GLRQIFDNRVGPTQGLSFDHENGQRPCRIYVEKIRRDRPWLNLGKTELDPALEESEPYSARSRAKRVMEQSRHHSKPAVMRSAIARWRDPRRTPPWADSAANRVARSPRRCEARRRQGPPTSAGPE